MSGAAKSRAFPFAMPLAAAVLILAVLPYALSAIGLTATSATEAVIFALACMALNILVGYTGLVSFGHGAWFGLAAYIAGIAQREWMPNGFIGPVLVGLISVAGLAAVLGALILRRRGVYFSLQTLALSAIAYILAFRSTSLTGGENGLGGITRPAFGGIDFELAFTYYWLAAAIAFIAFFGLWRFHNSPLGSVLIAIRENEQRARFIGYPVNRYKLAAFVLSATLTGLAGILLLFKNRMTSAEPVSVAFSGELLAMVVIGGMRSFAGPAIGALFFILFREFLSIYTENWLFWFGLIFVGFVVFSPGGLIGAAERLLAPFRQKSIEDAAMAARRIEEQPFPEFLRHRDHANGAILTAKGLAKHFGGIRAVQDTTIVLKDRTLHALIGPNGAGKTTAFNLMSGMYPPDAGTVELLGQDITGQAPEDIAQAGIGRSFQITNLFPALSVEENVRLAVQARSPSRFNPWRPASSLTRVNGETADAISYFGLTGIEKAKAGDLSYGGQRLLDLGLALATAPRALLLDEPFAGLAAAERQRIGAIVKRISAELPVMLVEHDIDRVFQLADHVTVMNEGRVLLDGTVEEARTSARVQEVYIGTGAAAAAHRPERTSVYRAPLLELKDVNAYYGKSHILDGVSFAAGENEITALLGRNGAGKSTLLKAVTGIVPPTSGSVVLAGEALDRRSSAEIARLGIGYVPQGRGLFAGLTVAENLELGRLRRMTGHGVHWTPERIYEYFPRIRDRLETPADYLSGGEQQMVAVARALSGDVRILLLDEPFEGLAPAVVEQLFEAFDRLRSEISIVIVDHHLDLALTLSDSTVVLERGRVTHMGPSAELRADFDLRRKVLWL
jgi:ABC-type branched-subunit amino acid transport system ATPase component/ABC-type branched-subunit amino acid transport system permease subunit